MSPRLAKLLITMLINRCSKLRSSLLDWALLSKQNYIKVMSWIWEIRCRSNGGSPESGETSEHFIYQLASGQMKLKWTWTSVIKLKCEVGWNQRLGNPSSPRCTQYRIIHYCSLRVGFTVWFKNLDSDTQKIHLSFTLAQGKNLNRTYNIIKAKRVS